MTGQEWRRRWQRSRPEGRARVDQNGLPRAGARGGSETEIDRIPDQPIGDASEPVLDRNLLVAALGRLTQEHRQVLRECYFRGSSVKEAAHALGIAPGAVKSRTYYALRALRLAIEELAGVE